MITPTPLLTREASLGEKAATNTGSKAKAAAAPLEKKFLKASQRMHATDRKNLLQLEKAFGSFTPLLAPFLQT